MRRFTVGRRRIAGIATLILLALLASGCGRPTLTNLTPASGPPGTVVEVAGENLTLADVKWDAGRPSERVLPSSFVSARFFSVPWTTTPGSHPVRLRSDGQDSERTIDFNVTSGIVTPRPRLDDVTVNFFTISDDGRASMWLMAHGANIDVGAQILVNGVSQQTHFYRLLRNTTMTARDPATLGYPIFHYATLITGLSDQTPRSEIAVAVRNLDGSVSNNLTYRIATNRDLLDSDGDGLPDVWETRGYDANNDGTIDVDLPSLGANRYRKDIFIEVDWMMESVPNPAIWADIESTFANAPILNSDGSAGITIHIDRGQPGGGGGGGTIIPYADRIRFDSITLFQDPGYSYVNFYMIKARNFDPNRLSIYRYCVFAWDNGVAPGFSGQQEATWSNDFFVSFGAMAWGVRGQRREFQLGVFLHELGHTLNLGHGGAGSDTGNSKDNYNSLMQYGNGYIQWMGVRTIYSPSTFGGIDVDCNQLNVDGVYTYSQGMRANLNEMSLNEHRGVCDNVARDWNQNGTIEDSVSFNLDDPVALTTISDYADWANIEINFRAPGSNWRGN